jgi:hypothetical protein
MIHQGKKARKHFNMLCCAKSDFHGSGCLVFRELWEIPFQETENSSDHKLSTECVKQVFFSFHFASQQNIKNNKKFTSPF